MTDTPIKIQHFVNYARSLKGYEKGEAQLFCDRLFQAFGHRGCIEAGAKLEYRLKTQGKHTKFPDLVWRPRLLLEMKSRGENLAHHIQQAREYWHELKPHPRYIVLCNFDDFWIYDTALQIEEPVSRVKLQELPQRYNILNFLFPGNSAVDLYNKATNYCENIPLSGAVQLVGRSQEIQKLKELLQQEDGQAIAVIVGMGGVGKTELANQYAWQHLENLGDRTGGVCWVDAREIDIGIQFVNFARSFFNLNPPEDWDLKTQLNYCWRHWQSGDWLIVIDDVTDYRKQVKPYLPPQTSPFKVLLTTRENLGSSLAHLSLDELKAETALDLLISLVGAERIQPELEIAQQISNWLGNLPLGLELVGRYLYRDPDLSLKAMLSLLEKKRLRHRAVVETDATMTAKLGVADAFDLSWERLDENAQQLGCMLSLFALADIPWWLIEVAYDNMLGLDHDETELEFLRKARTDLVGCHLLRHRGQETYFLHPLIREFLLEKREQSPHVNKLKQSFVWVMVELTKRIPKSLNCQQVHRLALTMPHIAEIAKDKNLTNFISDEDLIWPFSGLGSFYISQGLYKQAEPWIELCLSLTLNRLGTKHSAVVSSLNNLATLYNYQGRYSEAEPLIIQALELSKTLLGSDSHSVAISLFNIANLYQHQGRYKESEPFYLEALSLYKTRLGENHSDVPTIMNNLGMLYDCQGRYSEAEPLFLQALELSKHLWGEDHPNVGISLHNLALVYNSQGCYKESETLFLKSLSLCKRLFGENHPNMVASLCGLASVYKSQRRYGEAEPLFLQALELCKRLLGEEHPHVATSLDNLGGLYYYQGRYSEAEPLFLESLELNKRLFGQYHPHLAVSLNNLANLRYSQGRYSEAEPLYVQALEICERCLWLNHPHTVSSRKSLANLRNILNSTGRN